MDALAPALPGPDRELLERLADTLDRRFGADGRAVDLLALRRDLSREGLAAIDVPEDQLGAGRSARTALLGQFICGYADCDLRDVAHCGHGALILRWGDEERRALWAKRLREGQLVGIAATERGGSSLKNIACRARRRRGTLEISGRKRFVSRLEEADAFVLFCRVDAELCAVLVDAEAPGLRRQSRHPAGLTGWSWGDLELDRVLVPAADLLTTEGRAAFEAHFAYFRPMAATVCLGAAAKVLDLVAESLGERLRSGEIQTVRPSAAERAGAAFSAILAGFLLTAHAAELPYGSSQATTAARAAKAFAVQSAHDVLEDIALLLGAEGFQSDHPAAKARRDVAAFLYADGMHDALLRSLGRFALRA
jgi:alkylation response protein AidB-like acyl-CoA dehydrogenase